MKVVFNEMFTERVDQA